MSAGTIIALATVAVAVLGIVVTVLIAALKGAFSISSTLAAISESMTKLGSQVDKLTSTVSDGFKIAEQRTDETRKEAEVKIVRVHERMDQMERRLSAVECKAGELGAKCDARHHS
jgi:hypothetical protein